MFETHAHGLDILGAGATLGPRGRNTVLGHLAQRKAEILGVSVKPWDNADSFAMGDVVYHDHRYFRARRDVSAPFLSLLFDGEVPGKSDAWVEINESQAYNQAPPTVMGDSLMRDYPGQKLADYLSRSGPVCWTDDVLGMVDMQLVRRNIDDLKPVTVEIARILLGTGAVVISQAIASAKQPWYKSDLPGDTARKNVQTHLVWHANNLASIKGVNEQMTGYAAGDDLKKYVLQAFVESNAVEEGAAWLERAWNMMWDEIQTKLAAIPRAVGQAAAEVVKATAGAAAGGIAEGFGMPSWLFWGGIGVVTLGVGYGAYKWKFGRR